MIPALFLPLVPVAGSTTLFEAPADYIAGSTVLLRNGLQLVRSDIDGYSEVPPKRVLLNEPLRPDEVVTLFARLV